MKRFLLWVSVLVFLLLAGITWLVYSPKPEAPDFIGIVHHRSLQIEGHTRDYHVFRPAQLPPSPAVLFVLHGSLQTWQDIRYFSGYEFERLAMEQGFLLVYPQGYQNNWNDCRKSASYPAKQENINDMAFFKTMREAIIAEYDANPKRVFLSGFSNGAHFAYRVAKEAPEKIRGIAAISASLPTKNNDDCLDATAATSVLVMNGTDDPINPFGGGQVTLFGVGNRGQVMSSLASAEYFATLAGYQKPSAQQDVFSNSQKVAHQILWNELPGHSVVHITVLDGGHGVPNPHYRGTRLMHRNPPHFSGPELIWQFFSSI
jgi:polyhydroxybutyrate depolymerase